MRLHHRICAQFTGAVLFACAALASAAGQQRVDLLIRGGTVVDGSGAAPRIADVGIRGDRIVFVGNGSGMSSGRAIDAKGLIVAPGFIDPHTHTGGDLSNAQNHSNLAYLVQGVTTVITNN